MNFALIDKNGKLVKEEWFETMPKQPNPVKGLTWHELKEVTPPIKAGEKVDADYVIAIDGGTATKTYKIVPKTQTELDQDQKEKDIVDNLPSWQAVSDAIDAATTIAQMKVIVKKIARVLYWTARNSAT
jgi:hypothetical protein